MSVRPGKLSTQLIYLRHSNIYAGSKEARQLSAVPRMVDFGHSYIPHMNLMFYGARGAEGVCHCMIGRSGAIS